MRSRILVALAFTGLLMTALPLTASAHDRATCGHRPAWGYRHPNRYNGWWQRNCSWGYGYKENYFGNGGGWWPFAPAYSQYEGPRYYYNDHDADDWHPWHRRRWDGDRDWYRHHGWDRGWDRRSFSREHHPHQHWRIGR